MALPFVIPIGPVLSFLGAWFARTRERFFRDSRNPYLKSQVKSFGFTEAHRLPSPTNDAVALSAARIAEKDYESAKNVLITAWLLLPLDDTSELEFMRLREGFANLYLARQDRMRAESIASMPTILLDREVQWIVTHPDEQIGGLAITGTDESTEEKN
jgi:hypothetical protein